MALAGPQLAASAQGNAPQPAPAQEQAGPAGPEAAVRQPGDAAAAASAPAAETPSAGTQDEQTAASRSGGGRKRRHRRAKDESSNESTGTGNTWVSSPGSTAVEAIEPQQPGTATPVDGDGSATPPPGELPRAEDAAPVAEEAKIPAQQPAVEAGEGAAPAQEAAQAGSGTAPAPENIAGIPAQQTRHVATAAVQSPQAQAGGATGVARDGGAQNLTEGPPQPEAEATVPRQGQHAAVEAGPQPEPAAAQDVAA
ncbi:hypothetical protein AN219_15400, partial [Streptomyces nanshensis]